MSTSPSFDINNVQGDILPGIPKKFETSFFFTIADDVSAFRKQLTQVIPLITTAAQAQGIRTKISEHKRTAAAQGSDADLLPVVGVTLAFSQFGLNKIGIQETIGDDFFRAGQLHDATALGDRGPVTNGNVDPDWIPAFKKGVDGVFVVAGDSQDIIDNKLSEIEKILGLGSLQTTIHEVLRIQGSVRPNDQAGHEHFGFLDGISNPAISGFDTKPFPGQESISPGIILLGSQGDNRSRLRPSWAVEGSIMAFRYLSQLVPEFNTFLEKNPLPGMDRAKGSELLGARMVGRWKSGAPLDLAPLADDPALGADPQRNNNFRFDFPGDADGQDRCPFAAHVRKTNPRDDLERTGSIEKNRIIRRGIPFGPEVSPDEAKQGKTIQDRGLLFRCYQSSLSDGFHFIQIFWANEPRFLIGKNPGLDPIIGQTSGGGPRQTGGLSPQNQSEFMSLPEWVVSKGGEYLFAPSISALKTRFATAA